VAGDTGHARTVLAAVERFVWSFPEIEVIDTNSGSLAAWDD
jgi:hypothetical protein